MQLKFPNPERSCGPGQYGRARFEIDVKKGALLVPQRAVQELQNLYSLAVVGADNKVTFRNVKVGPARGQPVGHREGLKPGREGHRGGPPEAARGRDRRPEADAGGRGGGAEAAAKGVK